MSEPAPSYGSPDSADREAARKSLEAKRAFRNHVGVWALVSVIMVVIWALTSRDYFWPVWPIFGWGIGVAWHGFAVYGPGRKPISEADVDAELRRRQGNP